MGFLHAMTCHTRGIRRTEPVRWRSLEGMCGVLWRAEAEAGASGYYTAPDPRLMVFFDPVSDQVETARSETELNRAPQPLARALFVPAGVPMVTRFTRSHRFAHLDLHLRADWIETWLARHLGQSRARAMLRHPVATDPGAAVLTAAEALAQEVAAPRQGPVFCEMLAGSLVAGLLVSTPEPPPETPAETAPAQGGLTPAQWRALEARLTAAGGRRVSLADMAQAAGLSESWFSVAFKTTTGLTPLQWQQSRRIETAKTLLQAQGTSLSEIAARLGFADQAHLTRVFRQVTGVPPAQWRKRAPQG